MQTSHRSIHRARLRALAALALAAAAPACTQDVNLVRLPCTSACEVTSSGVVDNPTPGERAGRSVAILAWGQSGAYPGPFTVNKERRTVAAGAPDFVPPLVGLYGTGRIWLSRANANNGNLNTNLAPVFLGPLLDPDVRELGLSLHAADVRAGHTASFSVGGQNYAGVPVAYGEELLAGAPGSYGDDGAVEWFYNRGTPDLGWVHGGELRPTNPVADERFGTAITSDARIDAKTAAAPNRVAVGAPGANRVYVFTTVPGAATPFAQAQVITGPAGASAFGRALAMDDFNHDGLLDLAVGAPLSLSEGRVYIYAGQAVGSPFSNVPREVEPMGTMASGGNFGAALSSGLARHDDTPGSTLSQHPVLVVGAPDHDVVVGGVPFVDAGGICQFQFIGAGPMGIAFQRCDENPSPATDERYGQSVAVGNFGAMDENGNAGSFCATVAEVAVGSPGENCPGLADSGAVHILGHRTNGGEPPLTGQVLCGTRAAERIGRSLDADYIQPNAHEDLAVGAPEFNGNAGSYRLTAARDPVDPISGVWRATDSAGNTFTIQIAWDRLSGRLNVTQLSPATVTSANNGQVCSILGFDVSFTGIQEFPTLPWSQTAVSHAEPVTLDISSDVGFPASVNGTFAFDAATGRFTLDIADHGGILGLTGAGCDILNDPFVFTRVTPGGVSVCE